MKYDLFAIPDYQRQSQKSIKNVEKKNKKANINSMFQVTLINLVSTGSGKIFL